MMVNVYHLGLRNASFEDAEVAVAECIESCTFMPTVAEIRQRIPQRHVLDGRLYNRFHHLHGKARTTEEHREYLGVCRRLGVSWIASELRDVDRRLAVAS